MIAFRLGSLMFCGGDQCSFCQNFLHGTPRILLEMFGVFSWKIYSIYPKIFQRNTIDLKRPFGYHVSTSPFGPYADGYFQLHDIPCDHLISERTGLPVFLRPNRGWEFPQDSILPGKLCCRLDLFIDYMQFAPCPQAYHGTIINPHSTSHSPPSSTSHPSLLSRTEEATKGLYEDPCNTLNIDSYPIVLMFYGSFGFGT